MIPETPPPFDRKDLVGIEGLSREEVGLLLDTAASFRDVSERVIKKVPTLRGRTVINVFYEASTRTRTSFEIAGKRLSADVVNISASSSSVSKGESLLDTARNLQAMRPDIIVIRHPHGGAPHYLASRLDACVVNAGDGAHEHPTQALLDCLTIREKKGSLDGLSVLIVGDIRHSRVARSNIIAMQLLGAKVSVCGPATLIPEGIEAMGATVAPSVDEAIREADVIMVLRIQKERMGEVFFPSMREYSRRWGINPSRLARAKPGVLIMHPGPVNRGLELDPAVADGPWSVIMDQVTNGVAVRMAILYLLAGWRDRTHGEA